MVDMVGNNVNLGDKVIYCSRSSKKLVIGYLLKILGPKKALLIKTLMDLRFGYNHKRKEIKEWKKYIQVIVVGWWIRQDHIVVIK